MFDEVYHSLGKDGCICIFPEGTSHDRTDFIKLKAGVTFMALGAMNGFTKKNVKIVPVGLNYFNREQFRSEVIIEFGKPFTVPSEWAKDYTINKKLTTEKLLSEIEARMKAVTLTASSYEELRTLYLLRKIYVPSNIKLSPTQYSELCKEFIKGIKTMKQQPESKDLFKRVDSYIREIDEIAVTDTEVRDVNFQQKKMKRKFFISTLFFILYVGFLFPGLIIIYPFILYIRRKAEKERILAKAKNPNKIDAKDVVASVNIVTFLLCLPFIYVIWMIFFCYNSVSLLSYFGVEYSLYRYVIGSVLCPIYFYCKSY